jgi:uncharacterized protein YprB with RNaseH-like and TPR domain
VRTYIFDIETSNLRADIGSLRVACFAELNSNGEIFKLLTRDVLEMHGEKNLAQWITHRFEEGDIFIGHNSKAFDRNFINGVLIRHKLPKLPKKLHIDTLEAARYGMKGLLQSLSMDNLADYFKLPIQKDKPSKHDWRGANDMEEESIKRIRKRCISDVQLNVLLWEKLKPFWFEWKA